MKPVNDKSSHVKKLKKYLLALVVLSLALGVLVVPVERAFQINNIGDGIWWAIVTVTDVGYGDYVPVTFWGRLIGVTLMTTGVILFSLVVAILSSGVFRRESRYWRLRMKKDIESVNNKLYRLEQKLDYLIIEKQKEKNQRQPRKAARLRRVFL